MYGAALLLNKGKFTLLEYFIEIVKLAVDVPANGYRGLDALEVGLFEEYFFDSVTDLFDSGLGRALELPNLLEELLHIHRFKYYQIYSYPHYSAISSIS